MTKRIVSGIFILTALGALGVILAGALTSGEQLIVRFLTAVIVAALGLYVISDLRLQADDDAMTARSSDPSRVDTIDVPPNSTAAFMATVTKRGDQSDETIDSEADGDGDTDESSRDDSFDKTPVGALVNGASINGSTETNEAASSGSDSDSVTESNSVFEKVAAQTELVAEDDEQNEQDLEVEATASSAGRLTLAPVEAVESANGSAIADIGARSVDSAPATIKAIGLAAPKDVTLVDVVPGQLNGAERFDEAGQVDAAETVVETQNGDDSPVNEDVSPAIVSASEDSDDTFVEAATDSDITAEMNSTLFEQALNGSGPGNDSSSELAGVSHIGLASDSDDLQDGQETTALSEFEYSDELQAVEHEWPTPPSKPTEPAVEQPHPFEKASAAYQAEKERLAAEADDKPLPVATAAPAELEVTEYADAPLAPIIDLREVNAQNVGTVDAAINAGEVEVVATLIEQGMLSTEGPISDRDVRTMVYVAFTSNELRKLLLAGGSPEGPNYGLDLGPVELFDEKVHAPAPKRLYAGAPKQRRQPQSQIG